MVDRGQKSSSAEVGYLVASGGQNAADMTADIVRRSVRHSERARRGVRGGHLLLRECSSRRGR